MPDNKCANCTFNAENVKKQRYVTKLVKAKDVFNSADFEKIYMSVGVYSKNILNMGILKAYETLKIDVAVEPKYESDSSMIVNKAELFTKMLGFAKGAKYDLPECDLCCNAFKMHNITKACGRKGCTQRLCNDCGANWYGVLKPGALLLERHMICPFCTRKPDIRIINRWCPKITQFKVPGNLDPANYYAWCVGCDTAKVVAVRECGVPPATLTNWRCEDCTNAKKPVIPSIYKNCPSCDVMTERINGCNHITCNCGTHWCFECGAKCDSAGSTYEHMRSAHGRIYMNEEPYYNEDEDD
jgi:hypothetical protein